MGFFSEGVFFFQCFFVRKIVFCQRLFSMVYFFILDFSQGFFQSFFQWFFSRSFFFVFWNFFQRFFSLNFFSRVFFFLQKVFSSFFFPRRFAPARCTSSACTLRRPMIHKNCVLLCICVSTLISTTNRKSIAECSRKRFPPDSCISGICHP